MTVVAAFSVQKCPVVFGDLLITEEREISEREVAVPTTGNLREVFARSGWSISGLTQKVNFIGDQCAIGWAGNYYAARQAISKLRELALVEPLGAQRIVSFLQQEPAVRKLDASFVGWVREPDGSLRQFRYQAEGCDGGALGTVFLAGTGAPAIREFVDMTKVQSTRATGQAGTADIAVSTGLIMSAVLLRSELHGGLVAPTLLQRFGGGYEVAVYAGGRFQKPEGITFLIWQAEVNGSDVRVSYPELIIKQQYLKEVLLLRSARMKAPGNSMDISIGDEQFHAVFPIYDAIYEIREEDLRHVSLQSSLLCHCVLVRSGDERGLYTRVQRTSAGTEPTMTFEDLEGKLVVGLSHKFLESFTDGLREWARR